jgi:transcriptional regulator with XRE-family HTH domain
MDLDGLSTGRRIAMLRRRAGLTQAGLAMRIHRSKSWVEKVERGSHVVENISTLTQVAEALGVSLAALREDLDPRRPGSAVLVPLRQALTAWSLDLEPRPPIQLRADVVAAGDLWQTVRENYSTVAPLIPPLVAETRVAVSTSTGDQRREALLTLALICQVAQEVAARLGEPDLSWIAADRALAAAREADDPVQTAVGAWRVAHAFLRSGDVDSARSAAATAASELAPVLAVDRTAAGLSAYGALRLVGTIAAARAGDRDDVAALLADARGIAKALGEDRNDAWQTFGPTNTGVHATAVAMELGDPDTALTAARVVDPTRLLTLERQATHRVVLAHALAMRRRPDDAYRQLLAAERLNPEGLPHDQLARELVRSLRRRKGRKPAGLDSLATRLHVAD